MGNLYDLYETPKELCCEKCIHSFPPVYYIDLPCKKRVIWKMIRATPETINDIPELRDWFHDTICKLHYEDREFLCNWPSNYVELGLILLCHTFHSEKVQCFFLPDSYLPKDENVTDPISDEEMKTVKEGVTTLLGIVFQGHHFAVVKVQLNSQNITIWDSGHRTRTS